MSDWLDDDEVADIIAAGHPLDDDVRLAREVQEHRQRRCQTCKWWDVGDYPSVPTWGGDRRCSHLLKSTFPNWFCATWEARDG